MNISKGHAWFWAILILALTALLSYVIFQQAWIADWLKIWLVAFIMVMVY